jgi:branched-chain amino acid transport system substrate-binding protein
MKKSWILPLVLIVALGAYLLSRDREVTNSSEPIKIVALFPLTGGVASYGESSKNGTELAVKEINDSGGINGRLLEIIYEDHKCDPKTALSAYKQKVIDTKLFITSSCSGTVLSIAPNLGNDQALMLSIVVVAGKVSGISPFLFRNWPVESQQIKVISKKIKEEDYKKVAIIYEETDFATGLKLELENQLKDSGIEIISESFAANATDVRTQITKLKSANPDAIFVSPQNETTSEVILAQMEQLGFKPKQIFANDVVLNASDTVANHSKMLEGVLGPNYIIQSDRFEEFLDTYVKTYGSEGSHINASVVAYDSIYLLANSIRSVGTDPNKLRDYLQSINLQGISGDISFNSQNDRSEADYVLSTIKEGQLVPAMP